jgi:hypothetical protein
VWWYVELVLLSNVGLDAHQPSGLPEGRDGVFVAVDDETVEPTTCPSPNSKVEKPPSLGRMMISPLTSR